MLNRRVTRVPVFFVYVSFFVICIYFSVPWWPNRPRGFFRYIPDYSDQYIHFTENFKSKCVLVLKRGKCVYSRFFRDSSKAVGGGSQSPKCAHSEVMLIETHFSSGHPDVMSTSSSLCHSLCASYWYLTLTSISIHSNLFLPWQISMFA